ncbi:uncharacterized protein LOC111400636 [Olea europaea var. sylvestris]|uniref:uncharacterized protein LOC111400636 n=1 Tax=Olea europaea var. sylvestris TaxID=158386 RepID=UPI000C1D0BE0|nr:uncharacterized protein LOC111400636 [Olea europaea var. sylvestris]
MKCWNSVLLSKALWNIHRKKDTIWVKWINHMYLRRTDIWECQPTKGTRLSLIGCWKLEINSLKLTGTLSQLQTDYLNGQKRAVLAYTWHMIFSERLGEPGLLKAGTTIIRLNTKPTLINHKVAFYSSVSKDYKEIIGDLALIGKYTHIRKVKLPTLRTEIRSRRQFSQVGGTTVKIRLLLGALFRRLLSPSNFHVFEDDYIPSSFSISLPKRISFLVALIGEYTHIRKVKLPTLRTKIRSRRQFSQIYQFLTFFIRKSHLLAVFDQRLLFKGPLIMVRYQNMDEVQIRHDEVSMESLDENVTNSVNILEGF